MARDTRTPLIAGNWKMNLDHLQAIAFVQKLAWSLKDAKHDFAAVEVAVFPPFTDLRSVQTLVAADKLAARLRRAGPVRSTTPAPTPVRSPARSSRSSTCSYVIIGHSERRTLHAETDEDRRGQGRGGRSRTASSPIICVGETAEDLEKHGPSAVPVAQLAAALAGVTAAADIVVAYEPVWAIGSGQAATPEQAEQVVRGAARRRSPRSLGDDVAAKTRILYGGSVKSANIAGFMREPNVDGALVGGASLDVDEFAEHRRASRSTSASERRAPVSRTLARAVYWPESSGASRRIVKGTPWKSSRSSSRWCSASRASC